MQLADIIPPHASSGAALFLKWQEYHVFAITTREVRGTPQRLRFCGVGGKRHCPDESFADCALREGREEIGAVIQQLCSAEQTYFLNAQGELSLLTIADLAIRPRLIFEKYQHSSHGSMAQSAAPYYLVAFDAQLVARPQPQQELAAIVYLTDDHLHRFRSPAIVTVQELISLGAQIDRQAPIVLPDSAVLVPHGTAHLLLRLLG